MNWADAVNGAFEMFGGVMLCLNVLRTYRDKQVKGVNPWAVSFFASWGLWNLIFYPFLGQWLSFAGGLFLVTVNFTWFGQLYFYSRKEDLSCMSTSAV
jgi:hypothetical protein